MIKDYYVRRRARMLSAFALATLNHCFTAPLYAATLLSVEERPFRVIHDGPTDGESIVYHWQMDKGSSCSVTLSRRDKHDSWSLIVPELAHVLHWSDWQKDIKRYDSVELIQVTKGTLTRFNDRSTSPSLTDIHIAIHLVPETWDPFMSNLKQRMDKLGKYDQPSWSYWKPVYEKTLKVSKFVQNLAKAIHDSGYTVSRYGPHNSAEKTPLFTGRYDWDEKLQQPNLDVSNPGTVSFTVSKTD